jgi:AcrR family transcriptional regulator
MKQNVQPKAFDNLRAREKEARRRAIADIALALIREKGVEYVTIRRVAGTAGLSSGAIYMYFKNKEDLFIYLLAEKIGALGNDLARSMKISDPVKALSSMARDYGKYYLDFGKYVDIFRYLWERDRTAIGVDSAQMALLRGELQKVLAGMEAMIATSGMKKILKGISPKRAVPVLWAIVTGLAQVTLSSARGRESGFDFDRVLADLLYIVAGRQK